MIILRSLLYNAVYFGGTALLAAYGAAFCRTPERAFWIGRVWARTMIAALRLICRVDVQVRGLEHIPPHGPALLACQHQSAFDTMIWLTLLPRTSYVEKRELAKIPLFGPLTVLAGMIPVDRGGGAAAIRALIRATQAAKARDRQIVVFPEGTRAPPGRASPLHPGIAAVAAGTGLPVIPVRTDSGWRWGRHSFQKRPGTIHVEVLPAVQAGVSRAKLMELLQAAFAPVENPVGAPAAKLPIRRSEVF
jgi:1-acyl-sn-glycerol-3-phosphate acyltransferase